jgi:hypothetical protein
MSRSVWQSTKTERDYGSPTPFAKAERKSLGRILLSSDFRSLFAAYLRLGCASVLVVKRL